MTLGEKPQKKMRLPVSEEDETKDEDLLLPDDSYIG